MSKSIQIIQYAPFISSVNPNFWHKFTQNKLDIDKLNDEAKHIWGFYSNLNNVDNFCEVDCTSFNTNIVHQSNIFLAYGMLMNKNTIEEFKDCNKTELLNEAGQRLWSQIKNGECIENPALLANFLVLSFADLKKYKFFYWFAFPAPTQPVVYHESIPKLVKDVFNHEQAQEMYNLYNTLSSNNKAYFILNIATSELKIFTLKDVITANAECNFEKDLDDLDKIYFCFSDSNVNENPGWQLRNLISLLNCHCPLLDDKTINVLSIRVHTNPETENCLAGSLLFRVNMGPNTRPQATDGWVGWERNDRGKFGPKLTNMADSMDAIKLSETSVDLNLKLMKWRLLPDLDLEKIKKLKCLLLGSGTLGCGVARGLLGWGVRNITMIDSGRVSYSNPVRQSLFVYKDCLDGGKPKAITAAKMLKDIFPGVNSHGIELRIPMPGHPIGDSLKQEVDQDLTKLKSLIQDHDCVFLLTDSRESRWLPTLLGAAMEKIVINAALGFDSYLVMRHGSSCKNEEIAESASGNIEIKCIPGNQLGCYFCNDVTAPGNSLRDRTLDQQCTVTRPGVSSIAASLAVELLIALTQNPEGAGAPAYYTVSGKGYDDMTLPTRSLLGILPHSIRGFISNYEQVMPATEKFHQCIACSQSVLKEYNISGDDFLYKVFESAQYLEELTGLTELLRDSENAEIWEFSDSDDGEE